MKNSEPLIAILSVIFLVIACSNSSDNTVSESATTEDNITLSIFSSDPDSTLLFEAVNTGEWEDSATADSQETPFDLTVDGDNYSGSLHKLSGNAQMAVTLVAEENGEVSWEIEKEYDRIAQVTLDENFTSVDGK